MKRFWISLLLPLAGCGAQAVSQSLPSPQSVSNPQPTPAIAAASPAQQRLPIKLTLTAPEDLKVREGDAVMVGQTLSDRTRDRQRLEAQRQQLQLQMSRLQQPVPGAAPIRPVPAVAALPTAAFSTELAGIAEARLKVEAVDRVRQQQQRKLDLLQSLPAAEIPTATIPHEQEVLAQRDREVAQAKADLDLAQAQLSQAQKAREYQEYLHSLELSKRAIALQQSELERQRQLQEQQRQERDRAYQLAQLAAQMQQLENQLATLSVVRSPYSGKVQRIKWEGQTDQALAVELVLSVGDRPANPGSVPASAPTIQPTSSSSGGTQQQE